MVDYQSWRPLSPFSCLFDQSVEYLRVNSLIKHSAKVKKNSNLGRWSFLYLMNPIVFPYESYFVHMKDWSLVLNTAWVVLVLGPTLSCKSVLVVLHFKHPITNTYFCVGVWYWSTTKTLLHKSLRPPKSKLCDRPWFSQSSVMLCGCHYHAKACCRWYIS